MSGQDSSPRMISSCVKSRRACGARVSDGEEEEGARGNLCLPSHHQPSSTQASQPYLHRCPLQTFKCCQWGVLIGNLTIIGCFHTLNNHGRQRRERQINGSFSQTWKTLGLPSLSITDWVPAAREGFLTRECHTWLKAFQL